MEQILQSINSIYLVKDKKNLSDAMNSMKWVSKKLDEGFISDTLAIGEKEVLAVAFKEGVLPFGFLSSLTINQVNQIKNHFGEKS